MRTKVLPTTEVARAGLQDIGQRIRSRRKDLGVNTTAAAESAGMSRVTWHRIEKGVSSVAAGAYANALVALGLVHWAVASDAAPPTESAPAGWLPAVVRIAAYPQLRHLTWNLRGLKTLSPREALAIYERNWRHVDEEALDPRERDLIDALRLAFSEDPLRV